MNTIVSYSIVKYQNIPIYAYYKPKPLDLDSIISAGENQTTEFKRNFNDEAIESLVAFCNARGGKVLIGIDSKEIINPSFSLGTETIQEWANQIKLKTQPAIIPEFSTIDMGSNKTIVLITIQEFPIKPVSFKGRYFKRVNNSNHTLSAIEITELRMQS